MFIFVSWHPGSENSPMSLPCSPLNPERSSSTTLSSRSRSSDNDLGSLTQETPLAESGRAIDLRRDLSNTILQQLLERRSLFLSRFGKEFVSVVDNEMRERILCLPEERLSFLDRMHEGELGDLPSLFRRLSIDPVSGPTLVYRTPPTYAYIHKLLLYPRQLVIFLSESFKSTFGWQLSTLRDVQLEPCHILRSEDVIALQCNVLQECLKNPTVGTTPTFKQSLDILCANGTFLSCRLTHYTIRSSDLTPVYGMMVADPLPIIDNMRSFSSAERETVLM
jgi:hypothetical protein